MEQKNTHSTKLLTATFAAGCYWGVQDAYDNTPGVVETTSGYMGGHVEHPTYEQVCTGETGHYEAVQLKYDPQQVTYETLLRIFWSVLPHIGELKLDHPTDQYTPAIFTHSPKQLLDAAKSLQAMVQNRQFMAKDVRIRSAEVFYHEQDEFHQHHDKKCGSGCHT